MREAKQTDPAMRAPDTEGMACARRVRRRYSLVMGLDYTADMMLTVTSVLLFQELGMSSGAIFTLVAAVWIVEGVSELPTGVFADMLGHRRSVVVSFVLRAVGYGALFFTDSVAVAAAGTLTAAVGGTFASGAIEAWAVEEAGTHDPSGLDRLFAQGRIAENTGLVLGTLGGAALGTLDLALPQLAAGLVCVLAAFCSMVWMTSGAHRPARSTGLQRRLRGSVREVVGGARLTLRGDRVLLALIVGCALLWLFRGVPSVQWTAVYESLVGGQLIVLGLMRSVGSLVEIPLLGWSARAQGHGRTTRRTAVVTAATAGTFALAGAALLREPALSMLCYVCFSSAFGLCMPGVRAAMNERIDGRHRATVLSVAGLFNNLFTGGGLMLVGLAVDDLDSVAVAWPSAAAGFGLTGLWVAALVARPILAPVPSPAPATDESPA